MENPSSDSCLLKQVEQQETTAREFGFYWETIDQLLEQIQSECQEVKEAWQQKDAAHLQEEIGDLLQATICLSIFCQFDPHETLLKSIEKFQRRYDVVVKLANRDGLTHVHNQPFERLMHYWQQAKKET